MTIKEVMRRANNALLGVSDAPSVDAERIVLQGLGEKEISGLYVRENEGVSPEQLDKIRRMVRRRQKGEPLAYITGEWGFYGRLFYVNSQVLVPRPSTELLIDKTLKVLREWPTKRDKFLIADIGTGCGCIAISLLLEARENGQEVKVVATDISRPALAVAKENAARYGVSADIEFLEGDMLKPLLGREIDLVVSNPPYVPTDALEKSYRSPVVETAGLKYEPRISLDGGGDGEKFISEVKKSGLPFIMEIRNGGVISGNWPV